MRFSATRGFTLVELLVVVTIIAILSVIGVTVYSGVQKSARDARRKGDLHQIANALEMYKATRGSYPIGMGGSDSNCWQDPNGGSCAPLYSLIVEGFMKQLPIDPGLNNYTDQNSSACNHSQFYGYRSDDGTSYKLGVALEAGIGTCDKGCQMNEGGGWGYYEYCVYNQQ